MSAIDIFKESKGLDRRYEYYGIRRQEVPFESEGDVITHVSYVWEDGEETEEELDGVCALWLGWYDSLDKAIEASKIYYGKHLAIIASDDMEYGQDEGEIILRDPVVLCKLN